MNFQWIIAICALLQVGNCSIKNCCEGGNILLAKKCLEGSINNVLECANRFLLNPEDLDKVDEINGKISFGEVVQENEGFCRTNVNNSEVFIVCYNPEDLEEPSKVFIFIGFMSSLFLFITAAIYISLPKLLDLQGLCVVHSVLGLAFGFVIMGVNRLSDEASRFVCHFFAYSLYFCFLYAFFWLNTYSFHIWRTTTQPRIFANINHWKSIYHFYSCGCPLILLIVVCFSQVSNLYIYTHPRMAEESICWFGTLEASFVYMYVPISLLLSLNIIFFFLTIYALWKEIQQYDGKRIKIIRYRLSLCFKMFFVMGISWIFEVLSAAFEHKHPSIVWKITDTINSLQGLLIFLVMVVLRKRVYRLLAEKSYCQCLPSTWRSIGGGEEDDEECTDVNDMKLDSVIDE
ncbi:G-protein coupled receptor Mth2-like [Coccinella septempunctata]|uniref:G-protein coupled receptor Mth2-like n=1 Tax=Coccinella septempunctata TaxID=41139 RepID=UPI001D075916|nr:G-protein coupled receptor Mth2-like [Coccinella septempunctata]XP_044745540.1 G-protein coupled receptor Mth2-like [Coccinella septempunctata]